LTTYMSMNRVCRPTRSRRT